MSLLSFLDVRKRIQKSICKTAQFEDMHTGEPDGFDGVFALGLRWFDDISKLSRGRNCEHDVAGAS